MSAQPREKNANAKLSEADVKWVRWVYAQRAALPTTKRMAAILGIHPSQVQRIGQGKQWR